MLGLCLFTFKMKVKVKYFLNLDISIKENDLNFQIGEFQNMSTFLYSTGITFLYFT